ncbi:hypothetical protein T11_5883 [Trichinella zimbabwensis]|uniref:Uncharacterized protein n=1 Tax=Trichinella zimbabwensis TaxID=268475 RepID=A0A0V1I059_9BILA|nr:hypothetical protein T11_5883 [Trichinella zimbabwensis]
MTVIIPFMTLLAIYVGTFHQVIVLSIVSKKRTAETVRIINFEVHEMQPLRKTLLTGLNNRILRPLLKYLLEKVKETKDILMERLYSAYLLWPGFLWTGLELTANKNMKHFYLRTVGVTGRVQEVHL